MTDNGSHGPGGPRPSEGFDDFPHHAATGIPPEELSQERADLSEGEKGGAKTKLAVGLAAGAVVLAAGGVYAFAQLGSSSDHPYNELADGALMYVQTNVDPSASQKLAIRDLAKKFPELEEDESKILKAENLNGALLGEFLSTEKKYEYVGDRMALAAYPDANGDEEPEVVVAVQVTDEEAAEELLQDLKTYAEDRTDPTGELTPKPAVESTGVVEDGYLKFSTADYKDYFTEEEGLATNEAFREALDEVSGNVLSGYVDLAEAQKVSGFTPQDVLGQEAAPEAKVEGHVSFGLKARKDGLDMEVYSKGVKTDSEAVKPAGDEGKTAEMLEESSYSDAMVSVGVTGLGELVKQAMEAADYDLSEASDGELATEEVPRLLGENAALSVRYEGDSNLSLALRLAGLDDERIRTLIAEQGESVESLEAELERELSLPTEVVLDDGELLLVVGDAPDGGGAFESGTVTGSVDLDRVVGALNDAFGEDSVSEEVEDLGVVNFHALAEDDGDGKFVLGWTTPR